MKYTKLGRTGLDVSRICVGCMSFGDASTGNHAWTLDEDTSRGFIKEALDAGINFFDTANVYSIGTSEEIVGGRWRISPIVTRSSWRRRSTGRCAEAATPSACRASRS